MIRAIIHCGREREGELLTILQTSVFACKSGFTLEGIENQILNSVIVCKNTEVN